MKDNEASSTAFTVLHGLLYISKHPRHNYLVDEKVVEVGQKILSASEKGKKMLRQLDNPLTKIIVPIAEKMLLPGITLHYILRKRFIEEATRESIANGKTQVISLGAGFDTLAYRLHQEFPDVNFIEIDHPATNAMKSQALFGDGQIPENLNLLAVDFSKQNLLDALSEFSAFDSSRPTHFICEGVLMYLLVKDVTILLESLKKLTGSGTRFVFTALSPKDSPTNNTGPLLNVYLWFKKEPLKWAIEREDVSEFLTKHDFKTLETASTDTFRSRYLAKEHKDELHQGEYIVLSEIL